MLVRGISVECSGYDGLPIKNHLPPELRDAFRTRRQWLEGGFVPRDAATAVPMHPNAMNKKLVDYFYADDVEIPAGDVPRNCLTCRIRGGNRFCVIAGGFVGEANRCSEYEPKFSDGHQVA